MTDYTHIENFSSLGSMVFPINYGQTSKHTKNNFVRVRHYATQLTAASRPYPPEKMTHNKRN